ncbi:hypothetical protein AVEN_1071-1 [Araneus ventricosus]|uniref:Uncharacterized protein n=1 Tax=Araneus ventricosus TaxID=182803 RepID=A0A4Y2KCG3_ARAVE|nr:hypothetical protein AVEN_1071-1 [Araneus ventricosus]
MQFSIGFRPSRFFFPSRIPKFSFWSRYEWSALKSKTQSADSNLRPRCEGSSKSKDLPTLGPRVEARNEIRNLPCGLVEFCDFEPCLKTNFGTSVNSLLYFSIKMGGNKNGLRTNDIANLLLSAQL